MCSIFFMACTVGKYFPTINIEDKKFSTKLDSALYVEKKLVYGQVLRAKASSTISPKQMDSLKIEYTSVQSSFNTTYSKIESSIDSSYFKKTACIIMSYKRVVYPSKPELEKSVTLADNFVKSVDRAIPGSGSGPIGILLPIVSQIGKELLKRRIQVCKDQIDEKKYKNWESVQQSDIL